MGFQKTIKPLIVSSLFYSGTLDILRYVTRKNRVNIIMYHRFSNKPKPFMIEQKDFDNQIRFYIKRYNFITLQQYTDYINGKRNDLPNNPLIITMDDGYEHNFLYGYPVLKKYNIPATIFLATDFIEHKIWLWSDKMQYILAKSKRTEFEFPLGDKMKRFDVHDFENWYQTQLTMFAYCATIEDDKKDEYLDELAKLLSVEVPHEAAGRFRPMNWDQILEMSKNGIDYGSHTCSHPILTRISDDRLDHEIRESKKVLENKLQTSINQFCYPNGQEHDFNESIIQKLRKAGYLSSVTTIQGYNHIHADPFCIKRKQIHSIDRISILKQLVLD
ncbi:MAG: polysaccharide deacetylase family protein [Candidatus Cloacimonadia bacterium]